MNRDFFKKKGISVLLILMIYSLIFPHYIFALPQGGNVVSGQANIATPNPATMNIKQGSHKTIINWQKFNIANPETVRFLQPDASSVALNRVIGADPSAIYGLLTANGNIFLINPNGILVGASGRVEANSFLASTLNIKDEDFLSGKYTLFKISEKSLAGILNKGTISAAKGGSVALMAPGVENQGKIAANLGKVAIGSGEQVTLSFEGNELIKFAVDKEVMNMITGPDGKAMDHAIDNSGTISANGGEVLLSARVAYEAIKSVVNNSGLIEAASVGNRTGTIKLDGGAKGDVVNSGTLDVSGVNAGESGGTAQVTGEKVKLVHYSKIKARGLLRGGKVRIGGGFKGKNKKIRNSKSTFVGKKTRIEADAVEKGKGGDVVVWSDDTTRFYGTITAKGGEKGGDGGSVEVSGKKKLDFDGYVDLTAPEGEAGTLLLDPEDAVVDDGEADETIASSEETDAADGDTTDTAGDTETADSGDTTNTETTETADATEPEGETTSAASDEEPATDDQTVVAESDTEAAEPADIEADETAELAETTDPEPAETEEVVAEINNLDDFKTQLEANEDYALLELIERGEEKLGTEELLAVLGIDSFDSDLIGGLDYDQLTGAVEGALDQFIEPEPLVKILDDGTNVVLQAGSDIAFNDSISVEGQGSLTIQAGGNVSIQKTVSLLGGDFASSGNNFINTASIRTGGGNASINHRGSVTIAAPIATSGGNFSSTGTSFSGVAGSISTGSGSAILNHSAAVALGTMDIGGSLNVNAGGDITQGAAFNVAGAANFSTSGTNYIEIAEALAESIDADESVTDASSIGPDIDGIDTTAGGDEAIVADSTAESTTVTLADEAVTAAAKSIVLDATDNIISGPVTFNTEGADDNVIVNTLSSLDLGASAVGGGLTVSAVESITQSGSIEAGSVAVSSDASVTLSKNVTATDGDIGLSAGDAVVLTETSVLAANGDVTVEGGTVTGAGAIRSTDAGDIDIASEGDLTLESTSVVESQSVGDKTGTITITGGETGIVSVSGVIDASGNETGETGGTVHVLGEKVGFFGDASITASGDAGGGTVLIGGDYQGKNSDIRNALRTYVGPDAVIDASAISTGDGGRVIVWANENTNFYGNITATGGDNSGDGGFAEVSGKHLNYQGLTDLRAPVGETGTLLLDPDNIAIQDSGTEDIQGAGTTGDPWISNNAAGNTDILLTSTIETGLGSADVKIITANDGGEDGNITIGGTITAPSGSNDLILEAHKDITLSGTIDFNTFSSSGDVALRADGRSSNGTGAIIDDGGVIRMGSGGLQLSAGSGIGTSGAKIETENLSSFAAQTATGGIFINNQASGFIDVTTVTAADATAVTGVKTTSGNGGDISITNTAGTITVSQVISTANETSTGVSTGGITLTTSDDHIIVNAQVSSGTNTVVSAPTSGSITLTAGGVGAIYGTGSLVTGAATSNDGAADTATAGNITLSANKISQSNGSSATDLFEIVLGDASGGNSNVDGKLSVTTDGGAGTAGGVYIDATSGDINLADSAIAAGSGNVNLTASAGSILEATNNTTANITTTGQVALSAQGTGSIGSTVVDGAIDIASSTNLTLNTDANFYARTSTDLTDLSITVGDLTGASSYEFELDATGLDNGDKWNVTHDTTNDDLLITKIAPTDADLNLTISVDSGDIKIDDDTNGIILTTGGDVSLTATAGMIGQVSVSADANIQMNASDTLSLTASGDIGDGDGLNEDLNFTGSTKLVLDSDSKFNVLAGANLTNLTITARTAGMGTTSDVGASGLTFDATSNGTDATLTEVTDSSLNFSFTTEDAGSIKLADETIDVGGGTVAVIASNGDITETAGTDDKHITTTGQVTLKALGGTDNDIGPADTIELVGSPKLVLDTDGSIDVSSTVALTDLTMTVKPDSANTYALSLGGGQTATLADSGAIAATLSGDVNYTLTTDTGNITLGAAAIAATSGNVSLTATDGSIIDSNNGTAALITTSGIVSLTTANATGSIGESGPDNIDIATSTQLVLDTNASIYVKTNSDLSSLTMTVNPDVASDIYNIEDGSVTYTLTDSGTDLQVTSVINDGLSFSATTDSGAIRIADSAISVGAGNVTLDAAGAIIDSDDGTTDSITTTSGTVSLTAGTGSIGEAGTFPDTDPDLIEIDSSATNHVFTATTGGIHLANSNANNVTFNSNTNLGGGLRTYAVGNLGTFKFLTTDDLSLSVNGTMDTSSTTVMADDLWLATTHATNGVIGGTKFDTDVHTLTVSSTNGDNASITDAGSTVTAYEIATGGSGDIAVTQTNRNMLIET